MMRTSTCLVVSAPLPVQRPGGSLQAWASLPSPTVRPKPDLFPLIRPSREELRASRMEGEGGRSPPHRPAGGASPPLHPALAPLSFLLGRWRGEGEGGFPTINSFRYGEELSFSHTGKPVIAYTQKTWKLPSGEPMHAESGYWRPKPDGSIEVVISQSTGIVEVQKGTYDAETKVVNLRSELVGNASKVKEITRVFEVVNGELSYVVQMATKLASLQPHLKATLSKL